MIRIPYPWVWRRVYACTDYLLKELADYVNCLEVV